jgi:hypothetical protein
MRVLLVEYDHRRAADIEMDGLSVLTLSFRLLVDERPCTMGPGYHPRRRSQRQSDS